MIYWFYKTGTNNYHKEIENFFNEYHIEYKKLKQNELDDETLYKISTMDETELPYHIIRSVLKERKNVYYRDKKHLSRLAENKHLTNNIIVDFEKQKVCYSYDNIRKFIPRNIKNKQYNILLNKLREMDEENEEKYYLSDEFLE